MYNEEIHKLEKAEMLLRSTLMRCQRKESWFLPHHLVYHNGKARVVFNCSFNYQQACLNNNLLPGPTLSSPLLGVLLRFSEHAVAISGDIHGMFHQVCLLPEDRPLLRFLWRDAERECCPGVYECFAIWDYLQPMLCNLCFATSCARTQ